MDWNKWLCQKKHAAGVLVFLTAVCMMAWGVYRGEVSTVFGKAVNICLECIGLG
ncbi:MAG: hypothetical protein HFH03_06185 [Dorea sp.]|jgi:hypothetical protein|nr:hypothetical protein [Dorea sp.]